ncbi:hypothetical protein EV11_1309 [Prochlorococcus sp. SS52]|nr:hypothetical protein EV04_0068 [Prochlorococcus marinus str. LG]KGG22211.1 hypothetical protein EV08_0387 [Prochlorococcus marinus str. SS2]KGG24472.1 hypothetical protein EV09_0102 [Prochlorococcus marinus str. SS35]KGG33367.1 hypothetical protein EV10_0574 [Prochlorococcus marinus str. SS51]KGG35508.1 hypothetical protein EV11_1309 [Prochlorococcus sp. SS52]
MSVSKPILERSNIICVKKDRLRLAHALVSAIKEISMRKQA